MSKEEFDNLFDTLESHAREQLKQNSAFNAWLATLTADIDKRLAEAEQGDRCDLTMKNLGKIIAYKYVKQKIIKLTG